jgi:hypothetical protein
LLIAASAAAVVILIVGIVVLVTRPSGSRRAVIASAGRTVGTTVKFTSTVTVTTGGHAVTVERLEGNADLRAHTGEFTVTSPVAPSLMGTIRYLVGVAYFRYESLPLVAGKQWVGVTQSDVVDAPEVGRVVGGGDPTYGLEILSGTVGQPKRVAHEKVDGVDVTHYGLQLDLTGLFGKVGAAISQVSPALASSFAVAGRNVDLGHATGAVWLDAQGRVRRLDYTIDTTVGGKVTQTTTSWQLSSFGEAFSAAAPPPDQVVPLADVRLRLDRLLGVGS